MCQHIKCDSDSGDHKDQPFSAWFVVLGAESQVLAHRLVQSKDHKEIEPLLLGLKQRYLTLVRIIHYLSVWIVGARKSDASRCFAGQGVAESGVDRPVLSRPRILTENFPGHSGQFAAAP